MTIVDRMVAVTMAPIGVALGSGGVITLDFALLGSWAAASTLILILIGLDVLSEARGRTMWSRIIYWAVQSRAIGWRLNIKSRRAKRIARNLFCGGFITGAMACAVFTPSLG